MWLLLTSVGLTLAGHLRHARVNNKPSARVPRERSPLPPGATACQTAFNNLLKYANEATTAPHMGIRKAVHSNQRLVVPGNMI